MSRDGEKEGKREEARSEDGTKVAPGDAQLARGHTGRPVPREERTQM